MNKTDLIALVSEKAEISKKDAEKAVNAVIDTIIESVAEGQEIRIVGFGTFERHERSERIGWPAKPSRTLLINNPAAAEADPRRSASFL